MDKNTAHGKAVRTGGQTVIGAVVAFFTGLWAIPGVSEYVTTQGPLTVLTILGALGLSAGVVSFLHNVLGK